jgi:hypothetical protein
MVCCVDSDGFVAVSALIQRLAGVRNNMFVLFFLRWLLGLMPRIAAIATMIERFEQLVVDQPRSIVGGARFVPPDWMRKDNVLTEGFAVYAYRSRRAFECENPAGRFLLRVARRLGCAAELCPVFAVVPPSDPRSRRV